MDPVTAPRRRPDDGPSRIRAVRATDVEWQTYTIAAELSGMTRSEWIREALDMAAEAVIAGAAETP